MTVAVRPPEYFPRLPYAAVLLEVERFVVADTFSYSRQSAQNRCRIRTPGEGRAARAWLSVPLVGGAPGKPIREAAIVSDARWRAVHRKTLLHHYGSAPFFVHYQREVEEMIARPAARLSDLTAATVHWLGEALGAGTEITLASELQGAPATLDEVLEAVDARELVTLDESFGSDSATAARQGIGCRRLAFREQPRRQNFPGFVPGCSSLDLILNHATGSSAYLMACLEP